MFPVSNVVPLSEVAVCTIASLFVHLTIVPTLTVTVPGENDIPGIFITVGSGPVAGLSLDLLQEITVIDINRKIAVALKKFFFFIYMNFKLKNDQHYLIRVRDANGCSI